MAKKKELVATRTTKVEGSDKESKLEAQTRVNELHAKKMIDNLRIKEGMVFNMSGAKCVVIQRGSRVHLISMDNTDSKSQRLPLDKRGIKYATMVSLTTMTSWGEQDIMIDNMSYKSYPTKEEAKQAYNSINGL